MAVPLLPISGCNLLAVLPEKLVRVDGKCGMEAKIRYSDDPGFQEGAVFCFFLFSFHFEAIRCQEVLQKILPALRDSGSGDRASGSFDFRYGMFPVQGYHKLLIFQLEESEAKVQYPLVNRADEPDDNDPCHTEDQSEARIAVALKICDGTVAPVQEHRFDNQEIVV